MTKFLKNVVFYLLIIICAIMLFDSYSTNVVPKTDITYSAFMKHVQQDEVQQVTIVDNVISGKLKDGSDFTTVVPKDESLIPTLRRVTLKLRLNCAGTAVVDFCAEPAFADADYSCHLVFHDAANAGRRWRTRSYELWQKPCAPLR